MPIYEFVCDNCGTEFEELVFGSDEETPCPGCESTKVRRKPSAFAFKSGSKFVSSGGGSCDGCTPGPGGCSGCSH